MMGILVATNCMFGIRKIIVIFLVVQLVAVACAAPGNSAKPRGLNVERKRSGIARIAFDAIQGSLRGQSENSSCRVSPFSDRRAEIEKAIMDATFEEVREVRLDENSDGLMMIVVRESKPYSLVVKLSKERCISYEIHSIVN
ncbi:MAG TPA: hypothetical protein VFN25_09135 [Dokdonella sp.]|uniref:hypothetical protein n=1 Tax=Dokdonella sp. TaxID=2291710 RepID=UPI002D7F30B3|nr:hypothetical protein [Dokdonella sp.]HET9033056.1 hypothetical protein [Dokdonella sp.]